MSLVYNIALSIATAAIKLRAATAGKGKDSKFLKFARGQRSVLSEVEKNEEPRRASGKPIAWFHAASLGEYAIARPIIRALKARKDCHVVMTFFSSTGYEALKKNHAEIDELYYLPLDSHSNVVRFLDSINPDMALFMVSEYWYNYLCELSRRNVPTYLVSAKITPKSVFHRWYGFLHRKCLGCYRRIFVLDKESRDNLLKVGAENVEITGNPLFDNAISKSTEAWGDEKIETFAKRTGEGIFIAGSVHDLNDIELITDLANRNPNVPFIIVPHEVNDEFISEITMRLSRKSVRYTTYSDKDVDATVLIIDTIGMLAYLYRYGSMAYIGGGFTPYLHSIIEATVYGLPVAFGPRVERKVTPQQLCKRGLGSIVTDKESLNAWFKAIKDDKIALENIRRKADTYISENKNATEAIVNVIAK